MKRLKQLEEEENQRLKSWWPICR